MASRRQPWESAFDDRPLGARPEATIKVYFGKASAPGAGFVQAEPETIRVHNVEELLTTDWRGGRIYVRNGQNALHAFGWR